MNEFVRLLLLLTLTGAAVTLFGSAAIWFMAEERRIARALRHVLKGKPELMIVARGRGRGAGFRFTTGQAAVAWDSGAWCLIYRIDELMGAELIIDGEVAGRAYRGEQRRALDRVGGATQEVALRLVFDDPHHPDFELELWAAGEGASSAQPTPAKAVQEGNRWLARAESILRRPAAGASVARAHEAPSPPAAPPAPRPERAAPPVLESDLDDHEPGDDAPDWSDDPPWNDDPDDPLPEEDDRL